VLLDVVRHGVALRLMLLAPFAALVLVSATWTYNPWSSIVPGAMLVLNMVVAAALAAQLRPMRLLPIAAQTITILMIVSLMLLIVVPRSVISTPDRSGLLMNGEFFGVFSHKVNLGIYAVTAILIFVAMPEAFPSKLLRVISIGICTLALVLSNSASPIVGGLAAVIALVMMRSAPALRSLFFKLTMTVLIVMSIVLPFTSTGNIAEAVGRTATLTGRTSFWDRALGFILERPWFGYGYAGFFDAHPFSPVWALWAEDKYFFTPNFHNSALDVTIALGLVGLAAYIAILLGAASIQSDRTLSRSADVLSSILVLLVVVSMTDFQLMRHNALPTILLFYMFLIKDRYAEHDLTIAGARTLRR
jgi:exopolysaccharide production protein ExoQ